MELSPALLPLIRAQLERGAPVCVRAAGQSMWPTIREGATIVLRRLAPTGPRLGDVVLVARPDAFVLHRVVGVAGDAVVTKGDALAHSDPPVPRAMLIAQLARRPWDPWVARASRRMGVTAARGLGRLRGWVERGRPRRARRATRSRRP